MIELHDANSLSEGEVLLVDPTQIEDVGLNHRTPASGTWVILRNGDNLLVKETPDEIQALINKGAS